MTSFAVWFVSFPSFEVQFEPLFSFRATTNDYFFISTNLLNIFFIKSIK